MRRRLAGLLVVTEAGVAAEAGEVGAGREEEVDDGVEARVVEAVDEKGESKSRSISGAGLSTGGGVAEGAAAEGVEGVEGVEGGGGGVGCLIEMNTFLSSWRASLILYWRKGFRMYVGQAVSIQAEATMWQQRQQWRKVYRRVDKAEQRWQPEGVVLDMSDGWWIGREE